MPTNLDALLRYHTIDYCLQNRFRKWSWEDLASACADYAHEVAPRNSRSVPAKRTIQNDIRIMRSNNLGYSAPIANQDGYYFYTDSKYSIKNATLNKEAIEQIGLAAKVLGQYKGFNFFSDLNEIFERFECQLEVKMGFEVQDKIEFETTVNIKGKEWLKPILSAITSKNVLNISYQRFGESNNKIHCVHPYLLKEYQSRWYLLGLHNMRNETITLALDRILQVEVDADIDYIPKTFSYKTYFKDTIGITYSGEPAEKIILAVEPNFAPYLITKPLHHSQEFLKEEGGWQYFKFKIVFNQELENILLSYANHIKIITPSSLKVALYEKIKKATTNFS